MSRVNEIITCDHRDCKFWCESEVSDDGECTKPILYLDDEECEVLRDETD